MREDLSYYADNQAAIRDEARRGDRLSAAIYGLWMLLWSKPGHATIDALKVALQEHKARKASNG